MTHPFIARFRATGRLPTLAEKAATIGSIAELDGFEAEIRRRGEMSGDVARAVLERRAAL